jgi:hypothetical protein
MIHSRQTRKLAELRAKTDRQLVEYLSAQLNRALVCAATGESLSLAEMLYEEAHRLIPAVTGATEAECRSLTTRLRALRNLLRQHTVSACVA